MNFWKIFSCRWEEEELKRWSSIRKTAYLLLPLLIYFVVHDAAEFVLWAVLEAILLGGSEKILTFLNDNAYTLQGLINGLSVLIGAASIWPAVKNEICVPAKMPGMDGRGDKAEEKPKEGIDAGTVTAYCFLAAFAFCAAVSLNIFFTQTGFTGSSEDYKKVYEMQYGVQFAAGLILYGIVSPFAEEAVFRGLIYNRMKRCFNYGIALVVSSLLFGIYHGNVVQAVYGSILGILIAYIYELYKSFAAPVLFHGVANGSIFAMSYRNDLGMMDRKIALIIGTILFAAAIMIMLYIRKKLLKEEKIG